MRTWKWALVTIALVVGTSFGQVTASSQTGASASSGAAASADKSGVQASSGSSAKASQDAAVSRSGKKQDQDARAKAAGSASSNAQASSRLAGNTIPTKLDKPVDARHARPGDRVTAHTSQAVKSDGQTVIPKGSTMIGHVTEAKARTKGESESSLGIVFDQVQLKNGQTIPMHAVIQAIAAGNAAASAGSSDDMLGASGGALATGGAMAQAGGARSGGLLGGAGSTVGSAVGATTGTVAGTAGSLGANATSAVGSTVNAAGVAASLTSTSAGVIGMPGMVLSSQAAGAAQGSVLTSTAQNVHLDGGTQMVLRVVGQ